MTHFSMIDFTRNHFELFGVPARFSVDEPALERAYRALQSQVHPDRHAGSDDANQRLAAQASARVNEAYDALKSPVLRAEHLLGLHGIDAGGERDTALPMDFLERQLERREAVADAAAAADIDVLDATLREVRREIRAREQELVSLLDQDAAWDAARSRVRELKFLVKLGEDIGAALTEAEA
ncbi:MAG: Fe-S protein assembly co-chaperone HscB [Casimicrobiaceae bacterium]